MLTTDKVLTLILSAFYGDAFALGSHWIYDTDRIKSEFGEITQLTAPLPDSYHQGKHKGDFTHYGDLMLFILEHISNHHGFELELFKVEWQTFIVNYQGYVDGASKQTLKNIQSQVVNPVGAFSNDLAGAAYFSPFFIAHVDEPTLLNQVTELTSALHNHPDVIDTAIFFTKVCIQIINGDEITKALLNQHAILSNKNVKSLIQIGIDAKDEDTQDALLNFGTDCSLNASLPGVIQILL